MADWFAEHSPSGSDWFAANAPATPVPAVPPSPNDASVPHPAGSISSGNPNDFDNPGGDGSTPWYKNQWINDHIPDYAGNLETHLKDVRDGVVGFVRHSLEPERRLLGYAPDPTANLEGVAGDVHKVISGASGVASPLVIPAFGVAPVATVVRVGLGAGGQYAGKQAAQAAGAGPNVSDLTGDVAGGLAASKGGDGIVPEVEAGVDAGKSAIISAKQAAINKARGIAKDHPAAYQAVGGVAGALAGHATGIPYAGYAAAELGRRFGKSLAADQASKFVPPKVIDADLAQPTVLTPQQEATSGAFEAARDARAQPDDEPVPPASVEAPVVPQAPAQFPSGRKVGGIQNQIPVGSPQNPYLDATPKTQAPVADESQAIKDGLAQQFSGKPYAKLKTADKAAIDDLASKIVEKDAKLVPAPPAHPSATPQSVSVGPTVASSNIVPPSSVEAEPTPVPAPPKNPYAGPQEPVTPTQPTLYPEANPDREVHSSPELENEPSLATTAGRRAAQVRTAWTTRGRDIARVLNREGVPSSDLSLETHPVGHPLWEASAGTANRTVPSSPGGVGAIIKALREIESGEWKNWGSSAKSQK